MYLFNSKNKKSGFTILFLYFLLFQWQQCYVCSQSCLIYHLHLFVQHRWPTLTACLTCIFWKYNFWIFRKIFRTRISKILLQERVDIVSIRNDWNVAEKNPKSNHECIWGNKTTIQQTRVKYRYMFMPFIGQYTWYIKKVIFCKTCLLNSGK